MSNGSGSTMSPQAPVAKPQTTTPQTNKAANPYQQWISEMTGANASSQQAGQLNIQSLYNQYMAAGGMTQSQQQQALQQYGIESGQNTLAGQNIGLQQQGNTLSMQLAQALQGLQQQQYGVQSAENTAQYGLAGQQYQLGQRVQPSNTAPSNSNTN